MEMDGHVGEIFFKRSSFCKRLWGFPIGKDSQVASEDYHRSIPDSLVLLKFIMGCVFVKAWRAYSAATILGKMTQLNSSVAPCLQVSLAHMKAIEGHSGSTLTLSMGQLWKQPVCLQSQSLELEWNQTLGQGEGITNIGYTAWAFSS